MWKNCFMEEHVAYALRQQEAVAELTRKWKQLVADLSRDKRMLQDVLSKKH